MSKDRCQWCEQDTRGSRCRRLAEWMCWVGEDETDGAAGYYVLLLCRKHATGPAIHEASARPLP